MFNEKREKLIHDLNEIKQQIREAEAAMRSKDLKKGEAGRIITKLNAKREKMEAELLNLIVETEENFQREAWVGFKKGLVRAIRAIEDTVENSIDHHKGTPKDSSHPEVKKQDSYFNSIYAKIAERPFWGWIVTALLVYSLLIAVDCLAGGFKVVSGGPEGVKQLFEFATNPFSGLLVGMLATAVIQSSSTTTSIIVGLCAAGLPIASAIPMIMGANIGTSVTNTLVSMGHLGHKDEFRRAFAAATVHDFFNLLAVVIFLPLEMCFGILQKSSYVVAQTLTESSGFNIEKYNFIKAMTKPVSGLIADLFKMIPGGTYVGGTLFIIFGIALIFFSILGLGKILRLMLIGKAEKLFNRAVGQNAFTGIVTGMAITILVQSSSTTTSLIVPLAGAGVMTLYQVYPFTLGANIGTCITALIAALAIQSGAEFAIQIAFVHLFFNLFAVIFIYALPFLRNIPIYCAQKLANVAVKRKVWAFGYVIGIFFILPVCFIAVSKISESVHFGPYVCSKCQSSEISETDNSQTEERDLSQTVSQ